MKHTLQLLLITTVLTLPTTFGSEFDAPLAPVDHSETRVAVISKSNHTASTQASCGVIKASTLFDKDLNSLWDQRPTMTTDEYTALVATINNNSTYSNDEKNLLKGLLPNATPTEIRLAARILSTFGSIYPQRSNERAKHHTKAAKLFEQAANHKNITPNQILIAAYELGVLGYKYPERSDERTNYHDRAAGLYEQFANRHGATPREIQLTSLKLRNLGFSYPEGSEERTNYHDKAAKLIEQTANHKDAKTHHIFPETYELKALGSQYHSRASELFKKLGF
jgi:hypothetical protein